MEIAFGWDTRVENWMHTQLSTVYTVEKNYIKKTKEQNFVICTALQLFTVKLAMYGVHVSVVTL